MIDIPRVPGAEWSRNQKRRPGGSYDLPCVVCGSWIKGQPKQWLHVHHGGTSAVTEAEAATLDPAADLGCHPLGSCCLRKHPELKPYAFQLPQS